MALRNVIAWTLCLGMVVLLMTTGVQTQEEVPASTILEQIENGEDVYLEDARITGELNLSKIELKTVPIALTGTEWQIEHFGLEEELKIVESRIAITNSIMQSLVMMPISY
jgi:hypothetical protein